MKWVLRGFLFCLCAMAAAQARRPALAAIFPGKLSALTVKNAEQISPSDIVAASGLSVGQTVTEDEVKSAVKRLGDTGMFPQIVYSYAGSSAGIRLEFQVQENHELVPARFDNFIWWPDDELRREVRARLPLFRGELPQAGSLPDDVAEVLQALVASRNVQGHVDYLRTGRLSGPIEAIVYSISAISVQIRAVEYAGASAEITRAFTLAGAELVGADYTRTRVRTMAEKALLPLYLQQGYLQAAFHEAEVTAVAGENQEFNVDLRLTVAPGAQFAYDGVEFTGNQVFPSAELERQIRLQRDHPADALQLAKDLTAMQQLYATRGYLKATFKSEPQIDLPGKKVLYRVPVTEGGQYRFGILEIEGLDAASVGRLTNAWNIRKGEVFDGSYPRRFLDDNANLLPVGVPWKISVHPETDDKRGTVDVTLRFEPARAAP